MALTNPQYDSIMRMYNRRQLQHRHELEERRKTAYAKIPRLPEIDGDIASISVQKARDMLNGGPHAGLDLRAAIAELAQERTALLVSIDMAVAGAMSGSMAPVQAGILGINAAFFTAGQVKR